jgi:hypothetical protein
VSAMDPFAIALTGAGRFSADAVLHLPRLPFTHNPARAAAEVTS